MGVMGRKKIFSNNLPFLNLIFQEVGILKEREVVILFKKKTFNSKLKGKESL